jgi:ribosomal protein S18 acetylase RimI-like enzyme
MQTLDRTTAEIAVTKATNADYDRVITTVSLAFVNDPVTRWFYPQPHDFLAFWPQLVRAMGGPAFAHDSGYFAGDHAAGALWLPPGVEPDGEAIDALMEQSIDPRHFDVLADFFGQMDAYHPTEPYWHLMFLGVDPSRQGSGYGSALLAETLKQVDELGMVAALESTNIANVPLYERFGFEVTGEIRAGDIPPMYAMVRRAR